MSTRCHVIIREVEETDNARYLCTEHYVYHHCDGYPDGVGSELKKILESCPSYDWETIMEKILDYSDEYEEDSGIHGDEEYIYDIEAEGVSAILKCYSSDGSYKKELIFKETYPQVMRSDLDKKFKELGYKTKSEKYAFLDGVMWIESFPTETIIKRILNEALNTVPDLSNDLDAWVKVIKEKLCDDGN